MAALCDESREGKPKKNVYKYLIAEIGGVIISIYLWLGLIPMYRANNGFVWIYIGMLSTLFLAGLIRPRNVVYVWYRKDIKRKALCFLSAVLIKMVYMSIAWLFAIGLIWLSENTTWY